MDDPQSFTEQLAWVMANKERMGVKRWLRWMQQHRLEFEMNKPDQTPAWADHPKKWVQDHAAEMDATEFGKQITKYVNKLPKELRPADVGLPVAPDAPTTSVAKPVAEPTNPILLRLSLPRNQNQPKTPEPLKPKQAEPVIDLGETESMY